MVGTYTITVFQRSEGSSDYLATSEILTFQVIITDPCETATIDLSLGVVPDLTPSYTIGEAQDV